MDLDSKPSGIVTYIKDFYQPPPKVDEIIYPIRLGKKNLNRNFKHQSQKVNIERHFVKNAKHALEDYSRSKGSSLYGTQRVKNHSMPYSKGVTDTTGTKTLMESVQSSVDDYFSVATFHGLRYVGNTAKSHVERFFWLTAFVGALVSAAYFISQILEKYEMHPLITSIDPIPVPSHKIPFPSVTICSMNSVKKNESIRIIKNGTPTEKSFLEDICDFSETGVNVYDDETSKFENYIKFTRKVQPPCKQSLKVCSWRGKRQECDSLFRQVLTDDGICCTFNQLPMSYILRDAPKYYTFNEQNISYQIDDWNIERGYTSHKQDIFPFRSIGAGVRLGLSVVLDAELRDYYCSSTVSAGFKVLLHSPLTIPQMQDFAFLALPGYNMRLDFQPVIYNAKESVRQISIQKRHCYFNREKYLRYYHKYSESNCKMECLANYTLKICGCAPFHSHTGLKGSACSQMDDNCVDGVKQMMEISVTTCECLPSCFDLSYHQTLSYGLFTDKFQMQKDILQDVPMEYFRENMVVLNIFFSSDQFQRYTKERLYGFSEFLSSFGGLLGFFVGFSFLSIVELFYHFSLRLLWIYIRDRKKKQKKKSKMILVKC